MIYQIGQLADIIDGDRGKNYPKQNELFPEGYCLFLNAGNVTPNGFSFEENSFITQEKDDLLRKGKLQRGDIVYTTRGTVGNAALYSESVPFENIRINSGMVILRCHEDIVDKQYLYQILKSEHFRPYFKKYCTGSAQPQLPIMSFSKIELNIPEVATQRRIADILSTYDDLIENNRKQIKLLEEAAQRLYKEWFVNLRFPGHEHTKIVDGVPEGWEKQLLGDIVEVKYGKDHKSIPDGLIPVYGSGGFMRKCNQVLYDDESVLIPRKGSLNNIIYVDEAFWTVDTMFYTKMKLPNAGVFVYFFLKAFDMYSMNIGAAVPSMTTNILNALNIIIPNSDILERFQSISKRYFDKVAILHKQIETATQARDRLLPKLMSGKMML